jgi:hypothetical protein
MTSQPVGFFGSDVFVCDVEFSPVHNAEPLVPPKRTAFTWMSASLLMATVLGSSAVLTVPKPIFHDTEAIAVRSVLHAEPALPPSIDAKSITAEMRRRIAVFSRLMQPVPESPIERALDIDYDL